MPTMPKEYSRVAKREQRARESILKTGLLPYQDSFLSAVTRRDNRPEIACLSVGRGNGKTFLAGTLLAKALKPSDDPLYIEAAESVLVSASRPMAELTLEAARLVLGDDPEISMASRWRRALEDENALPCAQFGFTPGIRAGFGHEPRRPRRAGLLRSHIGREVVEGLTGFSW